MKILVAVKRVPDPETRIKLNAAANGIQEDGVKFVVNPFDENAVEESLRQKEAGKASEVIVLSIGGAEVVEQIRTALAMGADRGVHVNAAGLDSLAIAKCVAKVAQAEGAELVVFGKQAIDDDSAQVGPMVAQLLGWPQATNLFKLAIDGKNLVATREVDGGLEHVSLSAPAVVSTDLRINEPRYASLPGIMKAKRKEVKEVTPASLGVDAAAKYSVVKLETPPARKGGRKVASVDELVSVLQNEFKVI